MFLLFLVKGINAQNSVENFEGTSTLNNWLSIDCVVKPSVENPVPQGINTSARVLEYYDYGGLWGNIYFDTNQNLHLAAHPEFSFKIYVPSSSITGNQENQVTLKLQNSKTIRPWQTQTLISKPILLDQWQVVTFNFSTDTYENFDAHSPDPIERRDFDRVLLQVNGENNSDLVVAYFDDFYFENNTPLPPPTVYDQLIWSDEFNTDGAVNSNKWFHQTIFPLGNSWFSGEIQHYTNRTSNSYVKNGVLKVVAKKEPFTDQGTTKQYTSARLNSKFAFTYGRVEFRAKLPTGIGTWPAIWMLGKNINEKGAYWQTQGFGTLTWPNCGEMDIMEHWGTEQNKVISAVHTPST
ncbi:MAG: glycoside hydrolase family 16 protein, partial [Polaribacter sp.]|nr:glycoside hydrolase family 16 protein [Polaribacter sp.]